VYIIIIIVPNKTRCDNDKSRCTPRDVRVAHSDQGRRTPSPAVVGSLSVSLSRSLPFYLSHTHTRNRILDFRRTAIRIIYSNDRGALLRRHTCTLAPSARTPVFFNNNNILRMRISVLLLLSSSSSSSSAGNNIKIIYITEAIMTLDAVFCLYFFFFTLSLSTDPHPDR